MLCIESVVGVCSTVIEAGSKKVYVDKNGLERDGKQYWKYYEFNGRRERSLSIYLFVCV